MLTACGPTDERSSDDGVAGSEDTTPGATEASADPAVLEKVDPLLLPYVVGNPPPPEGSASGGLQDDAFNPPPEAPAPPPSPAAPTSVIVVGTSPAGMRAAISSANGLARTVTANTATVTLPANAIARLARHPAIRYIEADTGGRILNDAAITDSNSDDVHAGAGVPVARRGSGVVCGIIDTGIDWDHGDFRDSVGASRILSIWDQILSPIAGEAPPTGFTYGVEYTKADVDDELDGSPVGFVREMDQNGHGTHVAGSVASNGLETGGFVGNAPDCEMVIVRGSQFGSFSSSRIIDGLSYIFQRAEALRQPAAVNLSVGGNIGPHDGTSAYETALTDLSGPGKILVIAAGNEANKSTHTNVNVATGATVDVPFTVTANPDPNTTFVQLDTWYEGSDNITVTIIPPSGNATPPFPQNTVPNCTTGVACIDSAEGRIIVDHRQNPLNSDWRFNMQVTSTANGASSNIAPGQWTMRLQGVSTTSGRVDSWSQGSSARFDSPVPAGTVMIPGTARGAITVAAYSTKTGYTDFNGVSRVSTTATLWDIAPFSGIGPSRDDLSTGRKPEIAASGHLVISALSSDAPTNSGNIVQEGPGEQAHRQMSGTSMAAPQVTGITALLLESVPDLTPAEVESILATTVCIDTGECGDGVLGSAIPTLPDFTWGFGKINALGAVQAAEGVRRGGFPTADPNDGKLIDVSGQGVATIDVPRLTAFVGVPAGAATFDVEIFDGNQTGAFDVAPTETTRTCFTLTTDPEKDGPTAGELVIAQQFEDFFAEAAYTTLFTGTTHPEAQAPSGNFFYRLDVVTGPDCDTEDPAPTILNGFKIRASGQVGVTFGDWSFIAADAAGSFSSPNTFLSGGIDTGYDGSFEYYVRVPTVAVPTTLTFRDADADYLLDADSPGVATGANEEIRYSIFNRDGSLVLLNADVSGNYDVLAGDLDAEENVVATDGIGGVWRWRWEDVLTENNVHVWPPEASPPTLEVFGAPLTPLAVSAARGADAWLEDAASIDDFLPFSLGTETVSDPSAALVILSGGALGEEPDSSKVAICHYAGSGRPLVVGASAVSAHLAHGDDLAKPRAFAALVAELLAAKLNVAREADLGFDLGSAFVYGRQDSVQDVIDAADAILRSAAACEMSAADLQVVTDLTFVLKAINAAEVTYLTPQGGGPIAPLSPLRNAAGAGQGSGVRGPGAL